MIVFSCHGDFSDVTCKRGVANELLVPIYIPTDDNIGHCCPYTQVLWYWSRVNITEANKFNIWDLVCACA